MVAVPRRTLLAGGVLGAAVVGTVAGDQSATHVRGTVDAIDPVPPLGRSGRQDGVVDAPPSAAVFAACTAQISGRDALVGLFRQLTRSVARASHAGVSMTLAVGASLFDDRFGLAGQRPSKLTAMPSFPNDVLDLGQCHGDILVQVCADKPTAAHQALSTVQSAASNGLRALWHMEGFRSENTTTAAGAASTRNLFGFREGAGNPDAQDAALMDDLVWVQPDGVEPAWAVGGTYQVVRPIRFSTQIWDTEPVARQEAVFGRRKQDGAPLGKPRETDIPDYASDPDGRVVPLDAHIRRANPRTPQTDANRILPRGYSYNRGRDANGTVDEGLVFVCFQQDLERGFATIQRRLDGEALARYVLPFGGGYYFVPPAPAPGDYLCAGLIRAVG